MEETTTEPMIEPAAEYVEFFTNSGTIRLVYELSLGDLLVGTLLGLLLVYFIIRSVMGTIWR